jgi:fructose-1,6-bisphosphatase/inositol monophosphatase family enzyme
MQRLAAELHAATCAALAAGRLIHSAWSEQASGATASKHQDVLMTKGQATDLVTATDKACEQLMTKMLLEEFPEHSILGEETCIKEELLPGQSVWILDPIDGTTNFVHGNLHCTVLVALVVDQRVEVAVTLDPSRSELFFAVRGGGAFLHKATDLDSLWSQRSAAFEAGDVTQVATRIQVSTVQEVSKALVGVELGYSRSPPVVDRFLRQVRALTVDGEVRSMRTVGSTGLELAQIACGRLDAAYHWDGIHVWDVAAGSLLIQEAGGFVCSPDGEKFDLTSGRVLAAASPELAGQIANMLVEASLDTRATQALDR